MPYIKVDVGRINEYQRTIYAVRNRVSNISAEFSSIGYRIDEDIKDSGDIDRKIRRINSSLTDANTILGRMSTFLGNAALSYLQTEDRFSARAQSSGDPTMTNISALAETIAKKEGLDTTEVTEIIISGDYPMDEIMRTAVGVSTGGAFAAQMNKLAANKVAKAVGAVVQSAETAAAVPYVQPVQTAGSGGGAAGGGGGSYGVIEDDEEDLLADLVANFGMSRSEIEAEVKKGTFTLGDALELIEGRGDITNKCFSFLNAGSKAVTGVFVASKGASKVAFEVKNGFVIVSNFARNSKFNNLVKSANSGTGLGTRYRLDTLTNTPEVNKVFKAKQLADRIDKAADVVTAVTNGISDVATGAARLDEILRDGSLSQEDRKAEIQATVLTTAVATALDVGAPFAGAAVKAALTTAIPGVGAAVGVAAGFVVEKGMQVVAEAVLSEAVVSEVSQGFKDVGQAKAAGSAAVSVAAQKLKESDNAGEAIANTAALVGTAVVAKAKVVSTAAKAVAKTTVALAKESAKVVVKSAVQAAQTVTKVATSVANTAKKAAKAVKNFFKKW